MKKKLIASMLVMAMVISNSMVAWASQLDNPWEYNGGDDNSISPNVTATFNNPAEVMNVQITWSSLSFSYGNGIRWDESKNKYVPTDINNSSWVNSTGSVTVINNSTKAIKSVVTWDDNNSKVTFSQGGGVTLAKHEDSLNEVNGNTATIPSKAEDATLTDEKIKDMRKVSVNGVPLEIEASKTELNSGVFLGALTITIDNSQG